MDKDGFIANVNLIVGSTHNHAAMNLSVNQPGPSGEPCTLTLAHGTF
jgi:hypothetical protein